MLVQLLLSWFWLVPRDWKGTINFPTVGFRKGSLIFVVWKGVSDSSASASSRRKLSTRFWHRPSMSLFFCALLLVALEWERSSRSRSAHVPSLMEKRTFAQATLSPSGMYLNQLWEKDQNLSLMGVIFLNPWHPGELRSEIWMWK